MIADSGERTTYDNGFNRDMGEMKGRMGLKDEDHLASAVFNLFGLMYNEIQQGKWHDDIIDRRTEE